MPNDILPQGTGTPYLALFSGAGTAIIDQSTNMPIGTYVTDFRFEQKEGETKKAEIIMKVPPSFKIDANLIKPLSPIKIVYGWIFPDSSYIHGPSWDLMVGAREVTYSQHAVDFTLTLVDRTELLKSRPSVYPSDTDTITDIMKKLLIGNEAIFPIVVDYETLYTKVELGVYKKNVEENAR